MALLLMMPTFCMALECYDTISSKVLGILGHAGLEVSTAASRNCWRGSKISAAFLGVPIARVSIAWGLYWGPVFTETLIKTFKACVVPSNVPCRGRLPTQIDKQLMVSTPKAADS